MKGFYWKYKAAKLGAERLEVAARGFYSTRSLNFGENHTGLSGKTRMGSKGSHNVKKIRLGKIQGTAVLSPEVEGQDKTKKIVDVLCMFRYVVMR
ncbi:MAG: hypothetical protein LBG20_02150 [Holosporaceae bacterium]|nr:hypothetical protein [Holosporaceae bacterium]